MKTLSLRARGETLRPWNCRFENPSGTLFWSPHAQDIAEPDAQQRRQVGAVIEKAREFDITEPHRTWRRRECDIELAVPFDVATTNAVMKQSIKKIVINVQAGELQIHWHHVAQARG
jgi:hypothetical protein